MTQPLCQMCSEWNEPVEFCPPCIIAIAQTTLIVLIREGLVDVDTWEPPCPHRG